MLAEPTIDSLLSRASTNALTDPARRAARWT